MDSFPRQKARTRDFTLGAPRTFEVAADGSRVVFLRSAAGDDPQTALWVFDTAQQQERLVVDPATVLPDAPAEELSAEERARRERTRETGGGIVSYTIDRNARIAALPLSGRLVVADLVTGEATELAVPSPVLDPRADPTGRRVAFVHERSLHVVELADGAVTRLAGAQQPDVSWGVAEFVAAEEMNRDRGYWWSPDGEALLVTRVDESAVRQLWISDVANPASPPRAVRYPTAGSPNAAVEAYLVRLDGTTPVPVTWDRDAYPYLVAAHWDEHGPLVAVQTRDQRELVVLDVDPDTGRTTRLSTQTDDAWVDVLPGVPRRLGDGRLVTAGAVDDAVALLIDGTAVTPPDLEVRAVLAVTDTEVLFTASSDPTQVAVWRWDTAGGLSPVSNTAGVHTAAAGGGVRVIGSNAMEHTGTRWVLDDHVFESRRGDTAADPCRRAADRRPAAAAGRDRAAARSRARYAAARTDGSVRRAALPARPAIATPVAGAAVARRPGVCGDRRRRAGNARSWPRLGALGEGRPRPPSARGPGLGARRGGGAHPELDLSRVAIRGWSFGGISPRSPFCAARTSSTPRSPGRRSPTGGSTTRSTQSATWAPIPTTRTIGLRGLLAAERRVEADGDRCC